MLRKRMISFNDQACSVEIAEDRPRFFFAYLYSSISIYSHLDVTLIVNNTYIYKHTSSFVREMFLDSTLLFSDAIGDEDGVDTVADGGSEDVAVFKDDPDDDNDADDHEDDEKDDNEADDDDFDSNDAVATGAVMVIIEKDGDGDDNSGVDSSSVVSVGGVRSYR